MNISVYPLPIPNTNIKLCKNCSNFDPNTKKCHKFIQQSLINGSIYNDNGTLSFPLAKIVRSDISYCGIGGKYYTQINKLEKEK